MADDLRHARRPAERAGPGHPVRQHREEEMGSQLSLHGALRLRRRGNLLGYLGLQDVFRRKAPPFLGQSRAGPRPEVLDRAVEAPRHAALLRERTAGDSGDNAVLSGGDDGVVPVRVRGDYRDNSGGVGAREDELQGVDDVCAAVADVLLHGRSLQPVGRRLLVPLGGHGLFRGLRYTSLVRNRRIHYRFLG